MFNIIYIYICMYMYIYICVYIYIYYYVGLPNGSLFIGDSYSPQYEYVPIAACIFIMGWDMLYVVNVTCQLVRHGAFACCSLVGGLVAMSFIFPEILGNSSSQLTNSYFSEGWPNHQTVVIASNMT